MFGDVPVTLFGEAFDTAVAAGSTTVTRELVPEDGLYILYTSGTTGKPKAALISHRALLARSAVSAMDRGARRGSTFLAWPPMFHMASADNVLVTLIGGGKVVIMDGLQVGALCDAGSVKTTSAGSC